MLNYQLKTILLLYPEFDKSKTRKASLMFSSKIIFNKIFSTDNSGFTSRYLFPSSSWRWEWGTRGNLSLHSHQRPLLSSFPRALPVFASDPASSSPCPALECCGKPEQWADSAERGEVMRSVVWDSGIVGDCHVVILIVSWCCHLRLCQRGRRPPGTRLFAPPSETPPWLKFGKKFAGKCEIWDEKISIHLSPPASPSASLIPQYQYLQFTFRATDMSSVHKQVKREEWRVFKYKKYKILPHR